jgi:D-tyrosyl-tRNA(Tyr) deacylase
MDNSVQTGRFGAMMEISLINSGPITLFVDTKNKE